MSVNLKRRSRDFGLDRLDLRAGDRVVVRHDDGVEEVRTVSSSPMRIKLHDGMRWVLWLEGTGGWFALRRVRPAGEKEGTLIGTDRH